jgi:hypothetical protein
MCVRDRERERKRKQILLLMVIFSVKKRSNKIKFRNYFDKKKKEKKL